MSSTDAVSIDGTFRALADRRRRRLLRYLADVDGSVHVSDVVDALRAAEPGERTSPDGGVTVELRHVHLPKLDDAGLITYDPEGQTVTYHGDEFTETVLAACAPYE